VTSNPQEPGDRRPPLERPPGERYAPRTPAADADPGRVDRVAVPLAIVLAIGIAFTVLGGFVGITAGLIVVAGFGGWLIGRFVSPPALAAAIAVAAVVVGFLGIWAYGRIEGGVLDPIEYLLEVEGLIVVVLSVLAGGGLAAAASR
jgi:hypothetical protein